MLFLAGFTAPFTFNRDAATGDNVTLTGSNLKNVTEIQLVDENGSDLSGTPSISVPVTGVTVSDTSIVINTKTVQFGNGTNADSNTTSKWRRFKLLSARDAAFSPQNLRFQVGTPPTFTSFTTTGGTSNYRRDSDTLTITGTGFGLVTSAEIVDVNGLTITANSAANTTSGLAIDSGTQFRVPANSFFNANRLDSSAANSRRLKITTPFGVVVSDNNSTGAFTISATPTFHANLSTTFAGGGYNGGSNTYNWNDGKLTLNGNNFLGVKTIRFEDNGSNTYINVNFNPHAPPAGLIVNAEGTQLTITKDFINDRNATWANSSGNATRRIRLFSAADQNATTGLIITSTTTN